MRSSCDECNHVLLKEAKSNITAAAATATSIKNIKIGLCRK